MGEFSPINLNCQLRGGASEGRWGGGGRSTWELISRAVLTLAGLKVPGGVRRAFAIPKLF